jgi:outer membrane biosynthesis protein TonB
MAPAVQAPEPASAMAEEPTPEAPPEPAPVTPQPPTPQVKPSQAKASLAAKSAAAPAKPANTGLDLDALLASVASSNQRATTRQTSGLQGANRPRTDLSAQEGKGTDDTMSASEIDALRSKLEKLWNPNCQVEGAAGVNVKVRMRLTSQGWLAAPPELPDRGDIQSSGDPILIAAAQRALSAVGAGAPYVELNPQHYASWREMIVNFDAKKACAR